MDLITMLDALLYNGFLPLNIPDDDPYLLPLNVFLLGTFNLLIVGFTMKIGTVVYKLAAKYVSQELQLYSRRRTISTLLLTPIADRHSAIFLRWTSLNQRIDLAEQEAQRASRSRSVMRRYYHGWHSCLQWWHGAELTALDELLECKTNANQERVLFRIAFRDASRLGSFMTPQLRQHLEDIYAEWKALICGTGTISSSAICKSRYTEELGLIVEGEMLRRVSREFDILYTLWSPSGQQNLDFALANGKLPTWKFTFADLAIFEGDGLEFVGYGPSLKRLERLLGTRYPYRGCAYPWLELCALVLRVITFVWWGLVSLWTVTQMSTGKREVRGYKMW